MGITPNRLAVLGSNLLILINLSVLTWRLWRHVKNRSATHETEEAIAAFLPVYGLWFAVVTFLFPLIFNFK